MSGRAEAGVPLADWLSLAAAVLFAGLGLLTIRSAEALILRLATLGLPAWPAYAAAGLEILAALLLLHRPARLAAALLLVVLCLAGVVLNLAYREAGDALETLVLAALPAAVAVMERRRD